MCFNLGAPFQNSYYAVDGINFKKAAKSGLKGLFEVFKLGLRVAFAFVGTDFDLPTMSN